MENRSNRMNSLVDIFKKNLPNIHVNTGKWTTLKMNNKETISTGKEAQDPNRYGWH